MSTPPDEFLSYIKNVDPALEASLVEAFTPKGACRVATSPHFVFVISHLLRGFTPVEISSLVEKEKLAFVPASQIRDYQLQYIPPALMRAHVMYKFLQKDAHKLDEVEVLEALTKLQLARVMSRADKPLGDTEDQESARREIDLCHKMAVSTLDAKIKTGRVKQVPKTVAVAVKGTLEHVPSNTPEVPFTEAPYSTIDPRVAATALKAIERIALMGAAAVEDLGSNVIEAVSEEHPKEAEPNVG